ncbi:hypothetical protein BV898_16290 [Hypsibius exemplaris]|uniref:G-protein coupled receptors family 1 profile domain-containing protein n=1 Tax=Hypsibius exemplaris TaxID=2072580 RepID=A0A9X6ND49_HYPEX|nr:hypothetical protein BV898_16290 [Hypsibius exemplaris]
MNSTTLLNGTASQGGPNGRRILDACGRDQDLRYINDYTDWAWITKISFPIFLIICTVGNSLGIVVAWKDVRGKKRTFLLAFFSTNLCYMWNKFFIFLGSGIWSPPNPDELYGQFYTLSAGYWVYVDAVLFSSAGLIVFAFCLDRYIALTDPLRHYARKRRIGVVTTVVIIFVWSASSSLYSPISYYWQMENANIAVGSQVVIPESMKTWRKVDMWTEVISRTFTYLAIVLLDLIIVNSLRKAKQNQINLNASTASGVQTIKQDKGLVGAGARRLRAQRSVTRTLIISSLFYLVSQAMEVVMAILVLCNNPPLCSYQITMKFLLIYNPIQIMLSNSYYACSFLVYISPLMFLRTRTKPAAKLLHGSSSSGTVNYNSTTEMTASTSRSTMITM